MSLTQLTEGAYVANHWLAVLWCTGAGIYSYAVCIIDLIDASKAKKAKQSLGY